MSTEVELARVVAAWLRQRCDDVYLEVCLPDGGRADLVGVMRNLGAPLYCIVEVKRVLSLDLLAQAEARTVYAHEVFVAVPQPKRRDDGWRYAVACLRRDGVGRLLVTGDDEVQYGVNDKPRHNANPSLAWAAMLCAQHKVYAEAGSNGAHWTPYKATCETVLAYVKQHPGQTVRELVRACGKLHYATETSAIGTLTKRIDRGAVPGVRGVFDVDRHGVTTLHPGEPDAKMPRRRRRAR